MSQFGLFVLSTSLCFTHLPSVLVEQLFGCWIWPPLSRCASMNRLALAMSKKHTEINRGEHIVYNYLIM